MKDITIIGSGMAACQLIRDIRKKESDIRRIRVISPTLCHNYSKPQLSMLCRMKRGPSSVISLSHEKFCQTFNVEYIQDSVHHLDIKAQKLILKSSEVSFDTLVLAHGAKPLLPFDKAHNLFNYEAAQDLHKKINSQSKIAIIGGGLIGCEIADDFSHKLKTGHIDLFYSQERLLSKYVPKAISLQLEETYRTKGINLYPMTKVQKLTQETDKIFINENSQLEGYDVVITALGMSIETLSPDIKKNSGICADNSLRIAKNIYGLGDSIEIAGDHRPYIQPMMAQSNILSNILTQNQGPQKLSYPLFTVNVKTPSNPIAIIGTARNGIDLEYEQISPGVIFGYQGSKISQIYLSGPEAIAQKMSLLAKYEAELLSQ